MKQHRSERAFTLLEILIAMSILISIVLAVTNMLRSTLDIKLALAERNTVTQKTNRILYQISYDISQAFLVSSKDMLRDAGQSRTIFKIEKGTDSDTVELTYMGHKAKNVNAKESSLSYVLYEVVPSEKYPGRKNLYRAELPRVPGSFNEKPKKSLFADNIHAIHFYPWQGDDWSKEKWDSSSGSMKDKLPSMVLIEVFVRTDSPIEGEEKETDISLERYSTVVYLGSSIHMKELKEPAKRFKIY